MTGTRPRHIVSKTRMLEVPNPLGQSTNLDRLIKSAYVLAWSKLRNRLGPSAVSKHGVFGPSNIRICDRTACVATLPRNEKNRSGSDSCSGGCGFPFTLNLGGKDQL